MKPQTFRKKPVTITAMQNDGSSEFLISLGRWMGDEWDGSSGPEGECYIETLEGVMRADVGDYVIRGVKDEFYPCKPDIFEMSYEPV